VPSHIFFGGKLVTFPLAPLNVLKRLGPVAAVKAVGSLLADRKGGGAFASFEDFAVRTYGRYLAERFLISYSEKLWGVPAARLSPAVSGGRLSGLSVRAALVEAALGRIARSRHLDGSFYYPVRGIGAITSALEASFPEGALRLRSRVTALRHAERNVETIEVNGADVVAVDTVVSTLPIDLLVRLVGASETGDDASPVRLKYRHLLLVALFLDTPRVTDSATVYFPEPQFPFTRLSEPKNRSGAMAPADQTCLAVEVPCFEGDDAWRGGDEAIAERIVAALADARLIRRRDVIGHHCHRIPFAYPVLELGSEQVIAGLEARLRGFRNLVTVGRNGLFTYVHIHDVMRQAKAVVESLDAPAH